MSSLIDVQEPGDIVWTLDIAGVLHAWKVGEDGQFVEVAPVETLRRL